MLRSDSVLPSPAKHGSEQKLICIHVMRKSQKNVQANFKIIIIIIMIIIMIMIIMIIIIILFV